MKKINILTVPQDTRLLDYMKRNPEEPISSIIEKFELLFDCEITRKYVDELVLSDAIAIKFFDSDSQIPITHKENINHDVYNELDALFKKYDLHIINNDKIYINEHYHKLVMG